MVKAKSQKILWANSNVCRSYRGKTSWEAFLSPFPTILILNKVKSHLIVQIWAVIYVEYFVNS